MFESWIIPCLHLLGYYIDKDLTFNFAAWNYWIEEQKLSINNIYTHTHTSAQLEKKTSYLSKNLLKK